MNLEDVKRFIEENKENEEVVGLLKSYAPKEEPKAPEITPELIEEYVGKDPSLRSWFDSVRDQHSQKALETWKENNLDKLVEERIKATLPEEEQENLAIKELQDKIAQMEAEKNYEVQKNLALQTAQQRGIPMGFVEYLIGSDDEETLKNIEHIEEIYKGSLEQELKTRLKDNTYVPPKGKESARPVSVEDLADLSPEEINKFFDEYE